MRWNIFKRLDALEAQQKHIMSTLADLDTDLAALGAAITDKAKAISDAFAAYQAALAAGTAPADLTKEDQAVKDAIASLGGIQVPTVPTQPTP